MGMGAIFESIFWYGFYIHLICINLLGYFMYAYDKFQAGRGGWRVPEIRLLVVVIAGGGAGALLAMITCWHKIKKCEFVIKFVFCLALSIILYIVVGVFAVAPFGSDPVEVEDEIGAVGASDNTTRQELRQ